MFIVSSRKKRAHTHWIHISITEQYWRAWFSEYYADESTVGDWTRFTFHSVVNNDRTCEWMCRVNVVMSRDSSKMVHNWSLISTALILNQKASPLNQVVDVILVRVNYPVLSQGTCACKSGPIIGSLNMLWMFVPTTMANFLPRCASVPQETLLLLQQEIQ